MKNIKKIILIFSFMVIGETMYAQTPEPPTPPDPGNTGGKPSSATDSGRAPIGTATALLIGLTGACVAYKVRRNSARNENE